MCGIYASVSRHGKLPPSSALESQLVQRGPDHIGSAQAYVPSSGSSTSNSETGDESPGLSLTFVATVLSLRGDGITKQPVVSEVSGAILCWNGEAWSLGGDAIAGNDTAAIISTLDQASGQDAVLDVLRSIDGPFAFIYYDPPRDSRGGGRLYFGRDRLGRRSLLAATHEGGGLILSSIADPLGSGWAEVEADGIYALDVASLGDAHAGPITILSAKRYGWLPEDDLGEYVSLFLPPPPQNRRRIATAAIWLISTATRSTRCCYAQHAPTITRCPI